MLSLDSARNIDGHYLLRAWLVGVLFLGIGYTLIIPLAFSRAANDPDTRGHRQCGGPRLWLDVAWAAVDWVYRPFGHTALCLRHTGASDTVHRIRGAITRALLYSALLTTIRPVTMSLTP